MTRKGMYTDNILIVLYPDFVMLSKATAIYGKLLSGVEI